MMQQQLKSRRSAAAATVLTLALAVSACGGSGSDSGTKSADDTAAATSKDGGTKANATSGGSDTAMSEDTMSASDSAMSASSAADTAAASADCAKTDAVKLQLQWFTQAQFAGYYAAQSKGFYAAQCLEVEILEGGVDIVPQTQLANGDADFAIAWVPKALASREAGANIVDIAQIFQRSGTLQVSFKDKNIKTPADFKGKKIGNWGYGNEYEVFAALGKAGLDPAKDVELVGQNFDMNALLAGEIDAAEAMTYNEYAQVLEAINPATGKQFTPDDFNVVSYEEDGVGMLQDAIWANGEKLDSDADYKDIATRFVAASIQGWSYCRDNAQDCTDIVLAAGPTLGASHQLWQMNEVNKLIWPSSSGVGFIDSGAWDRTVKIAQDTPNLEGATVLTAPPTDGAYTNEIVEAASKLLADQKVDLKGESFKPIEVTLNEGGN